VSRRTRTPAVLVICVELYVSARVNETQSLALFFNSDISSRDQGAWSDLAARRTVRERREANALRYFYERPERVVLRIRSSRTRRLDGR